MTVPEFKDLEHSTLNPTIEKDQPNNDIQELDKLNEEE